MGISDFVAIPPQECYNEKSVWKGEIPLKYLSQFLIIMSFSLLGEVLHLVIPVTLPASVYGIILLFAALCLGIVKVEQVKETGTFLTGIMSVLFVPPVVGILEQWAIIKDSIVILVLLAIATTITTFYISGGITQLVQEREGIENE